jgi:hypothetical protein
MIMITFTITITIMMMVQSDSSSNEDFRKLQTIDIVLRSASILQRGRLGNGPTISVDIHKSVVN